MHNKKIIASGLVIGIAISSLSSNVTVNAINEYRVIKEEIIDNSSKDNKFENIIKNLLIKKSKSGRVIEGKVLNITLGENDTMPDLTDNPDEYEMIIVTTTGDRKLSTDDFSMLNISTIPNIDLSGAKANSIPSDAFINNTSLTGFKFPKDITSISNNSFNGCTNLSGVLSLPNSLTNIGENAFYGCRNLTGDLIIPNSVSNIGGSAFRDCAGFDGVLKLPETVTNIGGSAFYGCSKLTGNLVIPSSLKKISANVFRGCSGFTGDLIIPDTVTVIDVNAFYGCGGFNGKLMLSNNIKSISANAFLRCSKLKGDIIIPEGVTSIGASAFYNCNGFDGDLKMSDAITSIGANAFYNCSGLSGKLILPNSLKTVGRTVFSGTKFVGDVYIPNTLTTVDTNMFPDSINRIIIKISEEDEDTEYRKNVINSFTISKVYIEAPYTLDFKGTWIEESNVNIIQPAIKSIVDGVKNEVVDENNEKVILDIPMLFLKEECYALKDGEAYNFSQADINGEYMFTDEGDYEIVIKTKLGTIYNVQFGVRTKEMQEAEELVTEIVDTTPTVYSLEEIRKKVNALPESFRKEELQRALNSISVDLELEKKNTTANLDIYIKSENMLSLSIDTNSVTFENYSGTEDMIKSEAINLTVNSSLPYKVNASLESNIENKDGSNTIDISLLNIKASSDSDFKEFTSTKTPVILLDDQPKGNGAIHSIDLKLKGSLAYQADIYKTTIKLEIEQK